LGETDMTGIDASGPRPNRGLWVGLSLAALLAVVGIWSREVSADRLAAETQDAAIPVVSVAVPGPEPSVDEIVLPGTVQAGIDTPIFARASGYLKHWYTDIGTPVKAGQLLAEIDSPEVDQQLRQAQADLRAAQANERLARATATRVRALLPFQSVSQEQDDQAVSDAASRAAAVLAAAANVDRLRQLVGFERVTAPYDGVVTARETDVGNLINAGSGVGPELFRIADATRLRIYVQVPQSYAARVHLGVPTFLAFPEYPDRTFPAVLVRTAGAIEPRARTLLVELQVENARGELFPGGYTDVHLKLPASSNSVVISANALLFREEGLRVAVVNADGHVTLRPIQLGHDLGTDVEVVSGIGKQDRVILNPPASIETGDAVRVADAKPARTARS
jgi:RND family efflux transporter MFP subunit